MQKANPKELQEVYKLVCSLQWDLGRDQSVKDRAKKIVEFLGNDTYVVDIDSSTIDGLKSWLLNKKLSQATVNRYLSALSTMLTFCEDRPEVYNYRKPKFRWLKEPKHQLRYITYEEEKEMIRLFNSWGMQDDKDFFIMLIDTGLRLSELQNLKVGDCFNDRVTLTQTKTNESRGVPLTKRCQEIVKRLSENKTSGRELFEHFARWRPNSSWRKFRKAMKLENDKRFSIHACRRTLVSRLLNNHVPEKVIQSWVGHSDSRMIERYGKVLSSKLLDFVNVLEQPTEELKATDKP